MRVGRSAIDEDAIRLLEQYNPDVRFDWTHILKPTPQSVSAERPKERFFEPVQARTQKRVERRAFPRPGDAPARIIERVPEPVADEPDVRQPATPRAALQSDEVANALIEAADEASLADEGFNVDEEPVVELAAEDRTSAAYQRLGSEGLARLRARYAEVMARIAERPMDDAAREELKMRAERLNPDGWVTTEEVEQALEQYESVFEGLRALVGARRRRRRRRSQAGRTEVGRRKTED